MASIRINDTDFYYELHGQGQPLVLIAGYSCDHSYWDLMVPKLKERFQVLVFDNRAAGQSQDQGGAFSLEQMAADTMALLQHLDMHQFHLVGHSMGGAIAQIMAYRYRGYCRKMVLMNSFTHADARSAFVLDGLLTLRKSGVDLDTLITVTMPWFFSTDFLANAENVLLFKEVLRNYPYLQSLEDQERQWAALRVFDSRAWLEEIAIPSLVIAGAEDIVSLPGDSEELVNTILDANLLVLPGAHASPIEQADRAAAAIIDFCK
jgi:pimeloyl-ACP methyl ester carboxylesterase